ncbi:SGNH/GDSL hydrolase family protein [Conyzicola sp.]|uniref:SGNH/GDSL hydrolase family protein n=1 Tax=Conyzicola sp. TaxID=1969404 RepID=UPI003989199F
MGHREHEIGVADRMLNVLARPMVRLWLRTAEMSDPLLPRPVSPDDREPPEHNSDRVLLVGNGASVGYGVLSHDLSLAGHLGRQTTLATGRPTHVSVIADGEMTAGSALSTLRASDLERYDGVVLTIGVNEALELSPVKRWDSEIDELLAFLRPPATPHLAVFMVAIPPMESIAGFPSFVRWISDRHGRALNSRLRSACDRFDHVTFVPFAPARAADLGRYRSTETYRAWATLIAETVAGGLSAEYPRSDDQAEGAG